MCVFLVLTAPTAVSYFPAIFKLPFVNNIKHISIAFIAYYQL